MHEKYLQRCLELAHLGLGQVSPNPMVGAVIVHDDSIIGEGFHQKAGEAHAEVNALAKVKDRSLLADSTIYVSLEPCSYYGKTPPCSLAIVEAGIPRVVVGSLDPNPKVAGNGVKMLEENGIEVTVGVLEGYAAELNRRFFTFHRKKRPYVMLKWAQTEDGFIAPENDPGRTWITQEATKLVTHRWRATEDAILVGSGTVIKDDPELNLRYAKGKDPLRVILDRSGRLTREYKVFRDENHLHVTGEVSLEKVLTELHELSILSVMVEGGAAVLNSFIEAGLWDEARVLTGDARFGAGIKAPTLPLRQRVSSEHLGQDLYERYRNTSA